MAELTINRIEEALFTHTLTVDGVSETAIDNAPNLTSFWQNGIRFLDFKTKNGAPLVKNQRILPSEITITDSFGSTPPQTGFINDVQVWTALGELGYFQGFSGGSGGGGTDTFINLTDVTPNMYLGFGGMVYIVNEEETGLIPETFYNYHLLTQLEDVRIDALSPNDVGKMLAVQMDGTTPKVMLTDMPNSGVVIPNGFTNLGEQTLVGGNYTATIGYEWNYANIHYGLIENYTVIIEEETTGNSRIDVIHTVPGTNDLTKTVGTPSAGEGTALKPQIPVGSLELTQINIYEDNISEPTQPITGSEFITKSSYGWSVKNISGANQRLVYQNDSNAFELVNPALISIDGVEIGEENQYNGQPIWILNSTGNNITLINNAPDTGLISLYPFIFPNGEDMVVSDKGLVRFKIKGNHAIFESYSIPSLSDLNQITYIFPADINHVISYGQSLSLGATAPGITGVVSPNMLKFVDANNTSLGFTPLTLLGEAEVPVGGTATALHELGLKYGQSYSLSQMLFSWAGVGGASIDDLGMYGDEPSGAYQNFLNHVTNAKIIANSEGKSYALFAVEWTQGEADKNSMSVENYRTKLIALREQINKDVKEITGQKTDVSFVMYQLSSFNESMPYNVDFPTVYDIMQSDEGFYLGNPNYDKEYNDAVHLNAISYKRMGAEYGIIIHKLLTGQKYERLKIVNCSFIGKVLNLEFNKNIYIDDGAVNFISGFGFLLDGNNVQEVFMKDNRITIIFTNDLNEGDIVTYGFNSTAQAGRFTGPRGNVRSDEVNEFSFGNTYDWLPHSKILLTNAEPLPPPAVYPTLQNVTDQPDGNITDQQLILRNSDDTRRFIFEIHPEGYVAMNGLIPGVGFNVFMNLLQYGGNLSVGLAGLNGTEKVHVGGNVKANNFITDNATADNHAVALNQVKTDIAIVSDTTVAIVIPNLHKYYALTGVGALVSLPPISGNVGKEVRIVNKSGGNQTLYSNDGTSNDIWVGTTALNEFIMTDKFDGIIFNDGVNWVVK